MGVRALEAWSRDGVPARPGAWLTTVARRNALNAMARRRTLQAKLPLLLEPEAIEMDEPTEDTAIPDDRLRLVFTCCHPALAREAQVALTLRLVCGVGTADIAHAFLVAEPTMAARLTRAKRKIAAAGIPYVVPGPTARSTWRACCTRCCPPSARSRACWRCCSSTMPATPRAPTRRGAWCVSRTRTARRGIALRSRGPTSWSTRRCATGRLGASRFRPRSPRCTRRRRPTRTPTGPRSSPSTTSCCGHGPRRSWPSTARSRWQCCTAPRPG